MFQLEPKGVKYICEITHWRSVRPSVIAGKNAEAGQTERRVKLRWWSQSALFAFGQSRNALDPDLITVTSAANTLNTLFYSTLTGTSENTHTNTHMRVMKTCRLIQGDCRDLAFRNTITTIKLSRIKIIHKSMTTFTSNYLPYSE